MLSISKHRQNLVKIHSFILKILSGNKILGLLMGRNSVMNKRKLTLNNSKLNVVNIYAYAKVGQNPFFRSLDIECKGNSDIIHGP